VSVDTNVQGKNLAPYRTHHVGDIKVLIPRQIAQIAQSMTVDVSGGFRKKIAVEFSDGSDSCQI